MTSACHAPAAARTAAHVAQPRKLAQKPPPTSGPETLAPVWRAGTAWQGTALLHGALAGVTTDGTRFERIDLETGKPLSDLILPPEIGGLRLYDLRDGLHDDGELAVGVSGEWVAAIAGAPHERPRVAWQLSVGADTRVAGVSHVGGVVVVATVSPVSGYPLSTQLLAISDQDGAEVWRAKLPDGFDPHAFLGDVVLGPQYASGDGGEDRLLGGMAIAFDAADGTIRWNVSEEGDALLARDGERVVVAGPTALHVLDPRRGAQLANYSVDGPTSLAVAGGIAYLETRNPDTGGGVQAIELGNGREVWRYDGPVDPYRPIAVDADAVYVPTLGQAVRAIRRASGNPAWDWGIGDAHTVIPTTLASGAARLLVVDPAGVTAFAHGAHPLPLDEVSIEGLITSPNCGMGVADVEVKIGDDLMVRSDAEGRFRAHVGGHGKLLVFVTDTYVTPAVVLGQRPFVNVDVVRDACDEGD